MVREGFDRGPRRLMASSEDTSKAGWLTQHKKAKGLRRFFVSQGFQVQYYETEAQALASQNRKGCFNLGSCTEVRSSTLAGAPSNSVDLVLSEKRSGQPTLTVTMSFDTDGDRTAWLVLWCSAVPAAAAKGLDYRDAALAGRLLTEHADQEGLRLAAGVRARARWVQGSRSQAGSAPMDLKALVASPVSRPEWARFAGNVQPQPPPPPPPPVAPPQELTVAIAALPAADAPRAPAAPDPCVVLPGTLGVAGLSGTPCVSVRLSLSPGTQSTRASSFVYEGEGEGESEDEKARSPAPPWNPALLATPTCVAVAEGAITEVQPHVTVARDEKRTPEEGPTPAVAPSVADNSLTAAAAETEGAEAAKAEAAAAEATHVPHEEPRPSTSSRSTSSSPVSIEVDMLETGTPPPQQHPKGRVPSGDSEMEGPGRSSKAAEMAASSLCSPNSCVHERLRAPASNPVAQAHAPASGLERCLRCCSPLL